MSDKYKGLWALAICDFAVLCTFCLASSGVSSWGAALAIWCGALALVSPGVFAYAIAMRREAGRSGHNAVFLLASGALIGLYSVISLYTLVEMAETPTGADFMTIVY